jgi:hypothetical protein
MPFSVLRLFLRDIRCSDEVPPDGRSLLFCLRTEYLFRLLHFDLFRERTDDLCRQEREVFAFIMLM